MGGKCGKQSGKAAVRQSPKEVAEGDNKNEVKEEKEEKKEIPQEPERLNVDFVKRSVVCVVTGKPTVTHEVWVGEHVFKEGGKVLPNGKVVGGKVVKKYYGTLPFEGDEAPATSGYYYPKDAKIEYLDENGNHSAFVDCIFCLSKRGNGLLVVTRHAKEGTAAPRTLPPDDGKMQ